MTSPHSAAPPSGPAATASTRPLRARPWETSKALHAVYQRPLPLHRLPGRMLSGSRLGSGLSGSFEGRRRHPPGRFISRVFPAAAAGRWAASPPWTTFNAARLAQDYRGATERASRVDGHGRAL